MRWIQEINGRLKRGDTDFPEGDAFFVDEGGSKAIIKDVFYINGRVVDEGAYEITIGKNKKSVEVGKDKKIKKPKKQEVDTSG